MNGCPLSVLKRCPFYREFQCVANSTKTFGTYEKCPSHRGARFTEVSVKRELTVHCNINIYATSKQQ